MPLDPATGLAQLDIIDCVNGVSDNCSYTLTYTDGSTSKTYRCDSIGVAAAVTVVAIDPSGNITTGTVNITVTETVKPTIATNNYVAVLDASGQATFTAFDAATIADACSGIDSALTTIDGNCHTNGKLYRLSKCELLQLDAERFFR